MINKAVDIKSGMGRGLAEMRENDVAVLDLLNREFSDIKEFMSRLS